MENLYLLCYTDTALMELNKEGKCPKLISVRLMIHASVRDLSSHSTCYRKAMYVGVLQLHTLNTGF